MYDLGSIVTLAVAIPIVVFLWAGVAIFVKMVIDMWRD